MLKLNIMGNVTFLLLFFLSIPAGIIEEIEKIFSVQFEIFNNIDALGTIWAIYIYNILFSILLTLIIASVYTSLKFILKKNNKR